MPDRRGAAVLGDLPDDMVIHQILILLPPKDIGRCRVVCKSWRSNTSAAAFVLEHRRRQPSLPIIDGRGRPTSFVVHQDAVAAGASSEQLWPFPTRTRCRKFCCKICLHAACDGFIIVSQGVRFYVCNPTIHRHALLPFPRPQQQPDTIYIDDSFIHGFYQHKSTGEYRVLWSRLANRFTEEATWRYKEKATLHVLTVGDNESRSIQIIAPAFSSPSLKQMFELSYQLSWSSPVHHRGNLHWVLARPNHITGSTGDIIVFDTEAESFRWMSSPAQQQQGMANRVFDMEGTLAFVNYSTPDHTAMEIWLMQDYEAQIWAFKYRIGVSMIEASLALDLTSLRENKRKKQPLDTTVRFFSGMTVLNETELLIGFNDKHVLRCDTHSKFLQTVTIGKRQYCMELTRHRLQGSIVPIPSIEMQVDEFPYSTEHV
uniref:Uncharacterized protein n=1 Tax=Avena sativa TaxID=4498 RepID=A0ACD5ZBT1_AVESA